MKLDITATYSKKGFKYEKGNRIYLGNPFYSAIYSFCVCICLRQVTAFGKETNRHKRNIETPIGLPNR